MSTAQFVFAIALAVIAMHIVGFAVYVLSSTMWSNRWARRTRTKRNDRNREL